MVFLKASIKIGVGGLILNWNMKSGREVDNHLYITYISDTNISKEFAAQISEEFFAQISQKNLSAFLQSIFVQYKMDLSLLKRNTFLLLKLGIWYSVSHTLAGVKSQALLNTNFPTQLLIIFMLQDYDYNNVQIIYITNFYIIQSV